MCHPIIFFEQYNPESDFQIDWDNNGGVKIIKYIGTKREVSIPPNIQNNLVTGISGAFNDNKNITKVIIPNSVTSIGDGAFSGCTSLTSITIPNSVTIIGGSAFSGSGLASITIPDGVTSIGNYAFSGCAKLVNITIPDNVTSIGYAAFANCTGLTNVNIGKRVTSIKGGTTDWTNYEGAFQNCISLTNITIPDSVDSIEDKTFYNCKSLTSVIIGKGVKSIGVRAFSGCTKLINITIGNNVTFIDCYAFDSCASLASLTIPSSVTRIGRYNYKNFIFSGCDNLTSVTFQGAIKEFYDLDGFPGDLRVKYLASDGGPGVYNRFAGGDTWRKTQSITVQPTQQPTATAAASAVSATERTPGLAYTPSSNSTYWVSKGRVKEGAVIIPASYNNLPVTVIADKGFSSLDITEVIIPNSVKQINKSAFAQCKSLTSITIPDSVIHILNSAFSGCDNLTSVTFQGFIKSDTFSSSSFPGDLRAKYLRGGPGTYTRAANGSTWTKN